MKVYIINSITKSYILNIKIRPLVTEYALTIKLVEGTSSAHSFHPYAYFGHSWSYFDIQNLRLVILYIFHLIQLWDYTSWWMKHGFGVSELNTHSIQIILLPKNTGLKPVIVFMHAFIVSKYDN